MSLRRATYAAVLVALSRTLACASDSVDPDTSHDPECGNGVVEEGEACDVDSPGCAACVVVPNWTCTTDGCTPLCGDGVVGGAGCSDAKRDTTCDMTGWWAARETDYTLDNVVNQVQTSSTWYLYHFAQSGDDFHVVDEIECGIHVTGSVTVDGSPGTLRGLMYANRMDEASTHGARHGTSKPGDGGCVMTFDRWYKARGLTDAYLPTDFSQKPALSDLLPLPTVANPVTSTETPQGSTDPDGNGVPGAAFAITGFVSGTRDTAQRDWREFATLAGAPVPASALTFAIPGAFDLQESILRVTECGNGCALIAKVAFPIPKLQGRLTLAFIGKTYGGERVSRAIHGVPRADVTADLTSCANVRHILPHDPSAPPLPK